MLVGNRCHLSSHRVVTAETVEDFAKMHSLIFVETSAQDRTSFDTAFLDFVRGQLWNDTLDSQGANVLSI